MRSFHSIISPSRVAACALALICLAHQRAGAEQRYAFGPQRVTIVIPDSGWTVDPGPVRVASNVIFAARDAAGARTVLVMAMPLREKYGIEAEGLASSVEESISGHAAIRRSGTGTLRGADTRTIVADEHRGGTSSTLATAANGFLYVVSAYSRAGDAATDPDLRGILESFDFVGLPEVDYVATEPDGVYAWGYRIAGIIFFLLVAGTAGYLLGRRRRSARAREAMQAAKPSIVSRPDAASSDAPSPDAASSDATPRDDAPSA